jgi:caffeoyl-CoA O-methyltransferase
MALALPPAGHIWTIDPDAERTAVARTYLERAGVADKVDIINQPALEVLQMWSQRNLDIVFIDADKREYPAYLDLAIPMLKRSGLVVADNLLWGGEAGGEPSVRDSPDLRAIRSFNKVFLTHPQLDATIVPIGDGIGIGARIE